jgi:hypothetical protein
MHLAVPQSNLSTRTGTRTVMAIFLITMNLAVATTSITSSIHAQNNTINLTVSSLFVKQIKDNMTSFTGNNVTLTGTKDEVTNKYYELAEQFDKQSGIKPNENVTYIFKNKTEVTIPYSGYRNNASQQLLADVLHPLGEPGDKLCWINEPDLQMHYVCG